MVRFELGALGDRRLVGLDDGLRDRSVTVEVATARLVGHVSGFGQSVDKR